jgi:geranylgeranyl pyrophosphate synthase
MLMLPHCLKNTNMCKATMDELGLLCGECGNCNIGGFLQEAEELGYITVVTEGTTLAKKLVESGKVDAIIGVGCMEVLQRMFEAVHKYSVPAIGVPLLTCGCENTKADSKWIKEEIRHIDLETDFRLLNLSILKDKTAALFTESRIERLLRLSDTATDNMIREIMMAGGKRIRPLLTVLAFESFSRKPDPHVLEHLAMSVECFHKASLIHDDIEDNDATRYGKETLHARYGVPVAINTGDLLIGEGYRLLAESGLPPEILRNCLNVIANGHKTLAIGQGTELMARKSGTILPVDQVMTIFEQKTAAAFKVALLTGAHAAGADEATCSLLGRISHHIGIAFQLQDDLEDYQSESVSESKREGVCKETVEPTSILLALLAEKVADHTLPAPEEFRRLIDSYALREPVQAMLAGHLAETDKCLSQLHNMQLKLALHEMVGKIFSTYR